MQGGKSPNTAETQVLSGKRARTCPPSLPHKGVSWRDSPRPRAKQNHCRQKVNRAQPRQEVTAPVKINRVQGWAPGPPLGPAAPPGQTRTPGRQRKAGVYLRAEEGASAPHLATDLQARALWKGHELRARKTPQGVGIPRPQPLPDTPFRGV